MNSTNMIIIDGMDYSVNSTIAEAISAYWENIIAEGRATKYRPDGTENVPSVFYDVKVGGLSSDYKVVILSYFDIKNEVMRDVVVKAKKQPVQHSIKH